MRTRDEILRRVEVLVPSPIDPHGVMVSVLVSFLSFFDARRFIRDDVSRKVWNRRKHTLDEETIRKILAASVVVAWKAANARHDKKIRRSLMALDCVFWLLGDDYHAWAVKLFWAPGRLTHCAKPQLVAIHELFGLGPWQEVDDGNWYTYDGSRVSAAVGLSQWTAENGRPDRGLNGRA